MQKPLYLAIALFSIFSILESCQPLPKSTAAKPLAGQQANALIIESSPYLLRQAYSPVKWMPWGDEALQKAQQVQKPLLISIGYASCHWCHTMEAETFMDPQVAEFMNRHFVSIKVDREERPDVDQIYMDACQLLTGKGGWPLHAIAMPDGRPFFAGGYFSKDDWMKVLRRIQKLYSDDRSKLESIADQLSTGLVQEPLLSPASEEKTLDRGLPKRMLQLWKRDFDTANGGNQGTPKFPMPAQLQSLMAQYHFTQDMETLTHLKHTLDKIQQGAIYDHAGGGFFRYAADAEWNKPHFEKMLYDNALLASSYTRAYQITKKAEYRIAVYETLDFMLREMRSRDNGFFASLDADSDGHEGLFYKWSSEEANALLKEDSEAFKSFFGIGIAKAPLRQAKTLSWLSKELRISESDARSRVAGWKTILLKARRKRQAPAADRKQLSAWNAIAVKALAEAYAVFQEPRYLKAALQTADFMRDKLISPSGSMSRHYTDGSAYGQGFMDDYAFSIQAFIQLYEATFDKQWLMLAQSLAQYAQQHFLDPKSGYYYYASDLGFQLISRKMELSDHVIPSSNAAMAQALWKLGHILEDGAYLKQSRRMLAGVQEAMSDSPQLYSLWWELYLSQAFPYYEVAIVGADALAQAQKLSSYYLPQKVVVGDKDGKSLPILEGKFKSGQTMIYVCEEGSCKRPVTQLPDALQQLGLK